MNLDFDNDEWREEMLTSLGVKFQFAKTPEERREIWNVIQILHRGRSAAQVRRMEVERGLAR